MKLKVNDKVYVVEKKLIGIVSSVVIKDILDSKTGDLKHKKGTYVTFTGRTPINCIRFTLKPFTGSAREAETINQRTYNEDFYYQIKLGNEYKAKRMQELKEQQIQE